MSSLPSIQRHDIVDPLERQDRMAMDVVLEMPDGARRWCWFAHHAALHRFGDWIDGTEIPFHCGSPHMVVLGGPLAEDAIAATLPTVQRQGGLLACTKPVRDGADSVPDPDLA
ncbi:MAG: hypothetical protein AAGB15_07745 [Pseudomonadota bacterium]